MALFAMRRFLPVLLVLFAGSGCAALIYEIVWFQLLQLVIGSSAVSLAVLLGTYMGGMCLGSLLLPRLIDRRRHPLRVYAWIEAGIGICGLLVLFGVPRIDSVYAAIAVQGFAGILLRGVICAAALLIPTMLMGASLPAMARWVDSTREGIAWLGFFYGGNIAGAVIGSVLAGFYLLRLYDMAVGTYVAAAINIAVALIGLALSTVARYSPTVADSGSGTVGQSIAANDDSGTVTGSGPNAAGPSEAAWPVYVTIGLSGLCALGAEVVWTRLLSLMLGATVYTFSIILAVFLAGLGIGSGAGSMLARKLRRPRIALGVCQILLASAAAWAAFTIAVIIPSPGFDPTIPQDPLVVFQMDLERCAWATLPAALLWGASFPLALAALARRTDSGAADATTSIDAPASRDGGPGAGPGTRPPQDVDSAVAGSIRTPASRDGGPGAGPGTRPPHDVDSGVAPGGDEDTGWLTGRVYAANTIGGIIGALAFSMILIPAFGTRGSERWLIALAAISGFVLLIRAVKAWSVIAAALAIGALIWTVQGVPWLAIGYGRRMNEYKQYNSYPLYIGEGMNSSIVVSEYLSGVRYFHVSGKVEATTERFDMRLQRMLGHLSALLVAKPEKILVVGFGAGVTAGTFVLHPAVKRIVISEIEPLIPPASTKYFKNENYDVLHNPRTEVHYDDARHFVLTTNEKFDVITSDPIHPWVKGTSTLYSKEYFELCKQHLKPGGVVTQWVPLYESDFATVKSEFATFFDVFPHATIWNSDATNQGYDVVLVGQAEPSPIDLDQLDARLKRADHARVVASLNEVALGSAVDLMATYAGREDELRAWLAGAEINRDLNMRLQYLAGWGLNYNRADLIYGEMLRHRGFPADLFRGSENSVGVLRSLLEGQGR